MHNVNNENRSFPISINSCHAETLSAFPDPAGPHLVVAEAVQVNPVTKVSKRMCRGVGSYINLAHCSQRYTSALATLMELD